MTQSIDLSAYGITDVREIVHNPSCARGIIHDRTRYHFLPGFTAKLAGTEPVPIFNLEVPTALPEVDSGILDPRDTYDDPGQWTAKARDLGERFIRNFEQYTDTEGGARLVAAGPQR